MPISISVDFGGVYGWVSPSLHTGSPKFNLPFQPFLTIVTEDTYREPRIPYNGIMGTQNLIYFILSLHAAALLLLSPFFILWLAVRVAAIGSRLLESRRLRALESALEEIEDNEEGEDGEDLLSPMEEN